MTATTLGAAPGHPAEPEATRRDFLTLLTGASAAAGVAAIALPLEDIGQRFQGFEV